jgi:uncharacterized protein
MTANDRIDLVDGLRGYALLGLFMVHCVERFELYWLDPMPDGWFDAVFALFSGKAYAIFALLFGFSFATIMANERARGGDFTWRFVWRLLLLFLIGTLHGLIYRGDILQVLAAIGVLLIPFDRLRSDRILLIVAALLFLQIPLLARGWGAAQGWATALPLFWSDTGLQTVATGSFAEALDVNARLGWISKWSFYLETGRAVEIAGLFLVGMVLQRRGLFARAGERRGLWLGVLAAGATFWVTGSLAESWVLPWGGHAMTEFSLQELFIAYRGLGATAFQVALFVLAWHSLLGRPLASLVPAGRMTLTLYVGQSLVFAPLFYGYGFGLWDDLTNAETVLWGIAAFALQLVLAAAWFRAFRYGPLEWLWRAATRTTLAVPFRRVREPSAG